MLEKIKAFIIDLDGCVYRGNSTLPGVTEFIEFLRRRGRKILYLTNNASRTREEIFNKLREMNVWIQSPSQVLTSGIAAAIYLKREFGSCIVYPIGMNGLIKPLIEEGHLIRWSSDVDYVVSSLDFNFNYGKLATACEAIFNGAEFIATNLDPRLPVEDGYLPGSGAISAAIETVTGVKPKVIGKPSKIIMEIALSMLGVSGREVAVIGDRVETDVVAGKKIEALTILVLTGESDGINVNKLRVKPDIIVKRMDQLKNYF